MSTTDYIVLRPPRRDLSLEHAPPDANAARDRGEHEGVLKEFISIEAIDDHDVSDLQRDPSIQVSPTVPVSLVKPIATEDLGETTERHDAELRAAKQNGASWGALEVAPQASTTAGSSVRVAVLDTGIDADHPAFGHVSIVQKNFSASPYSEDKNGHGTHCAGTIFGGDVDGVRIGVARGVGKAFIGKVLDDNGHGTTDAIARGIQWAQQAGAQVISVSIGINFAELVRWYQQKGKEHDEALSMALAAFRDTVRVFDSIGQTLGRLSSLQARGVVVVAAAGNESNRQAKGCKKSYVVDVGLPAAALDTVSVGAFGRGPKGYQIAPFSNINPQLCAPGVDIISARPGGALTLMSGTSMAAPHVAGLCALWWERCLEDDDKASGDLVRSHLRANCLKSGFAADVTIADRGAGRVQAPAPG